MPSDFLKFAEEDLKGSSDRCLVNALSNVKRGIDCRVEALLFIFGLSKISQTERWGFPRKLESLVEIGLLAPKILNKELTEGGIY